MNEKRESKKPLLVSVAGGTGRYSLLQGLKDLARIVAFYNITDSGGSSGILRVEHGVLPPGDGTQALAALARNDNDEHFLLDRFSKGRVTGHRIANLMYEAATRKFGSDLQGIKYLQKLFQISGQVLPISAERGIDLVVGLKDGNKIVGEHAVDTRNSGSPIMKAWLSAPAEILPEAKQLIAKAEIIVFGPGDLWTSTIPHLLITGVPEAIRKSPAVKILVCNLVTKPGETDGYKASNLAEVLTRYLGCKIDQMIVNDNLRDSPIYKTYKKEGQEPIDLDDRVSKFCNGVHKFPLATIIKGDGQELLRHDPEKSAQAVMEVYMLTAHQGGTKMIKT